jgi:TetR/AcrR family transcriptional regulator, transcriptional repressor of bet genes
MSSGGPRWCSGGRRQAIPKIVDHEARRTELAEALYRVAARSGMKGVTIRSVSAEAGWSRDAVNHYFAGKDQLLVYACRLAVDRTLSRVRDCCTHLRGRAALRTLVLEGLALDGAGPEAAGAWLELLQEAGRDPRLAAEFVRFDAKMREEIGAVLCEMADCGEASPTTDPSATARALFGFNLELESRLRLEPGGNAADRRAAEVDAYLDRLLPGS